MKKGDIVWIEKRDGSIFCSEFDDILYSTNFEGRTKYYIKLIPIIGNCINIFLSFIDLEYSINHSPIIVLATFDEGDYHSSEYVTISIDIYKLIQ